MKNMPSALEITRRAVRAFYVAFAWTVLKPLCMLTAGGVCLALLAAFPVVFLFVVGRAADEDEIKARFHDIYIDFPVELFEAILED